MAIPQIGRDLFLCKGHHLLSRTSNENVVESLSVRHSSHSRGDGYQKNVVLILSVNGRYSCSQHSQNQKPLAVYGKRLASQIAGRISR